MRRDRRGFSVVSILVVLALLSVAAAIALPAVDIAPTPQKVDETTDELRAFDRAVKSFWWDCRAFPTALTTLQTNPIVTTPPAPGVPAATYGIPGWKGPYLIPLLSMSPGVNSSLTQDAWNTTYVLTVTGATDYVPTTATSSITITSAGPDKTAGTEDDLAQIIDVTFLRMRETVNDRKVLNIAIASYNAQYLATAPLGQDLAQILSTLRSTARLPAVPVGGTDDFLLDGWGESYVPFPASGPVTRVDSNHVSG